MNWEQEQTYMRLIKKRELSLEFLSKENQTYDICLAAVRQAPMEFKWVKDEFKSEEMCLAAVEEVGDLIKFIENPSEKVKLAAIKENGWALQYINNPTDKMKSEAIKSMKRELIDFASCGESDIEDQLEDLYLFAVNQDRKLIKYIPNPSEAVKLKAIRKMAK